VDGKRVVIAPHSGTAIEQAMAKDLADVVRPRAKSVRISEASASDVVLLAGCEGVTPECLRGSLESLQADMWLVVQEDGPIVKVTAVDGSDVAETPIDPQDPAAKQKLDEAAGGPPAPVATEAEEVPTEDSGGNGTTFDMGRVGKPAWILLAVGGGMTVFGLTLHLIANGKQDDVDAAPIDTVADFENLRDLEDSGKSYRRWGNVFTVSGVAVGLAGVGLGLYQALSSDDEPAVQIAPTGNGVQVRWSF
jgi:hypothetical protein